jgi:crotonobetainyl-CoA:carnitine CoA-transferase CaiB-like acyl-CoA transferase
MLLADLGADVVKIEPPTGDAMRQWPPLSDGLDGESFSQNFASVNRNKRSVVADLKDPEQLKMALALVRRAEVVVENSRPGVLDRLGVGFEAASRDHPGLVYCSISGFGSGSPYAHRGAFDVVIQGMSGLMSVTGDADGDPVKCGVPVGDFVAGLYAAYTIAAVLPRVRSTGRSIHIDCPMLDCLIAVSALQTSEYWGTGRSPRRLGSAHPRNAPYQAFHASDGMFTVAAGNDRLWWKVCEATGLQRLIDDPRFIDQRRRAANQHELAVLLQEPFAKQSVEYWLDVLDQHGVPCGPINSFEEMLADDHVRANGLVQEIDVPVAGPTPIVVYPARLSGIPHRLDLSPPRVGEHTAEVLAEWGSNE